MAFEILSIYHANPVIQTLISNNALPDPVFAFSLASSGAELRIGGVNSALYTGSLTYTPVTQKVGGGLITKVVRAQYVIGTGILADIRGCYQRQWKSDHYFIFRGR